MRDWEGYLNFHDSLFSNLYHIYIEKITRYTPVLTMIVRGIFRETLLSQIKEGMYGKSQ